MPASGEQTDSYIVYRSNTPMTRHLQPLCQTFVITHHEKSARRCVGKTVNYYVNLSCWCVFTSSHMSFIDRHISMLTIATYMQ